MSIDPFSVAAVVLGAVAMVFAVRRQRRDDQQRALNGAAYLTREQQLEKRVTDLEEQLTIQKNTIGTLQAMLYDKQAEIDRLKERIRQLEANSQQPAKPAAGRVLLLACIGDDAMLRSDLAHLRRVQAQRPVRLSVLDPATMVDLENALDRQRLNRTPVRFLHFGVHSSQQGLQLADGLATWEWLSERLDGVEVVMLAGCSNDQVADMLRVVNAVVSIRARDVPNKDAGPFVEAFWMAIAEGLAPDVAFERALEQAPARLGEYVELHL